MGSIAFIGTREPEKLPADWAGLYDRAVDYAVDCGHRISTGAAIGADQRAANRALERGGIVELSLPWAKYESIWRDSVQLRYPDQVRVEVYDRMSHLAWTQSVAEYHPNAMNLSRGAEALHARNYGIVAGTVLTVALPSTKSGGGGTGQGVRVCKGLGIVCFDLSKEAHRARLREILEAAGH